jgi:hypothetical protein
MNKHRDEFKRLTGKEYNVFSSRQADLSSSLTRVGIFSRTGESKKAKEKSQLSENDCISALVLEYLADPFEEKPVNEEPVEEKPVATCTCIIF